MLAKYVHVVPIFHVLLLVLFWNVAHAIVIGNEVLLRLTYRCSSSCCKHGPFGSRFFCYPNGRISRFIDTYVLLCLSSQILRAILGYSTDGGYGAIGLSVGGSGFLYSTYIVYLICARDISIRVIGLIGLALFGLLLTGQRTNIAFLIIFCAWLP